MKNYTKTLFICTGNVYRSVIAEKLFAQKAKKYGFSYKVQSRGLNPYYKKPHPLLAEMVYGKYSITIRNHKSQKVSPEDISWASIIVCFTEEQKQELIKLFPDAKDKVSLIYDILFINPDLFKDVDYHAISTTNENLLSGLDALKLAIDKILIKRTLSIVMAVYNEEKNIGIILGKLLSQSYFQRIQEIIVVSSGCTDRTNEIIESMESSIITLVREENRNGKVTALKKAVSLVTGEIVLLLDGDVDIDNNFLQKCFSCIDDNKLPCAGQVVPIKAKSFFFYELSLLSCDAWNALRKKNNKSHTFLYPSGYTMLLSSKDFSNTLSQMCYNTINDDGLLSLFLYKQGVIFHYCENLRVWVLFPQSLRDYFRQKIRTRMGRRQESIEFFKNIEKQWRKELLNLTPKRNMLFVFLVLLLDILARCIANLKIKLSRNPHLWSYVVSTKQIPVSTTKANI